jgi:hypothetical protein
LWTREKHGVRKEINRPSCSSWLTGQWPGEPASLPRLRIPTGVIGMRNRKGWQGGSAAADWRSRIKTTKVSVFVGFGGLLFNSTTFLTPPAGRHRVCQRNTKGPRRCLGNPWAKCLLAGRPATLSRHPGLLLGHVPFPWLPSSACPASKNTELAGGAQRRPLFTYSRSGVSMH